MSDDWVVLIPEDPRLVPEPNRQTQARVRFAEIAPDADEIVIKLTEQVQFFDCGANFERVSCPSCAAEMSTEWWQDRMEEDFEDGGFKLASFSMPCCNKVHSLEQLDYEWPQGFARFAIEAMNPNISDEVTNQLMIELEPILGTRLRAIYQHL